MAPSAAVEVQRGPEALVANDDGTNADHYWVPTVDIVSSADSRRIRIYEFYWADASRYELGWVSHLVSFVRLTVGLPRLALFGIQRASAYSVGVFVCWTLMLIRTLWVIANLWVGPRLGFSTSISRRVLILDVLLNSCFFLFGLSSLVLRGQLRKLGINAQVGMICTTISFLLLQSLPYAFFPIHVGAPSSPSVSSSIFGRSDWFYAPNTLVGVWPYLEYWAIWAFGASLIALSGIVLRRAWLRGALDAVEDCVSAWTRRTLSFILVLAFSSLVFSPGLFLLDLLSLLRGDLPADALFDSVRDPLIASYFVWLVRTAVWPAAFVSGALILSGDVRQAMKPILELVFDLESYLFRHVSRMVSAEGIESPLTLRERLAERLSALVSQACGAHKNGVVVVAHSLGSVIAWESLLRLPPSVAEKVDFLTMGSPLMTLSWAYPGVYGRSDAWMSIRARTRSWHNLYQGADVVGRALTFPSSTGASIVSNRRIGGGGHLAYFEHAALADQVLACWQESEQRSAAVTASAARARETESGL